MNTRSGSILLSVLVVLSAGAALSWSTQSEPSAHTKTDACAKPDASALTDEPIAAWRVELLDLAFRTASAMPLQPHVKNRSRAQEQVVTECLGLDQTRRAAGYVERIANWRRGAGYADLAFHLASSGHTEGVQTWLDLALEAAATAEKDDNALESAQEWKQDRIRARIAQTYVLLGRKSDATRLVAGAVESESGKVAVVEAMHAQADDFDELMAELDPVIATGTFDQVRTALEACARLFDRFHADVERRTRAEEKIKASWGKLPIPVRLELLIQLGGFALDHDDTAKSLELVDEAQAMVAGSRWTPDHQITFAARLATLRHRAGDAETARSELAAALALFEAQRERIVNIDRAGVLRALAEAHASVVDVASARGLYARAIEAGVENPNSRPRAEDLAATCRSMARTGVEPGAELLARMVAIHDHLGVPW